MYWCASIESILALLIVWFIPKQMTRQEIYNTWAVTTVITLATNILLALTFHIYYVATPKSDWEVICFDFTFPPAMGVILLNFMPPRRIAFIRYVVFVVLLSDCIELVNVYFKFITYNKWNILYSSIVYALGMVYLRWHLHFLRHIPR